MEGGTGSLVTYKVGDREIEGYYLGISYHGNTTDNMHTRLMIIRKDTGKVVEAYPTQVTFIEAATYDDTGG